MKISIICVGKLKEGYWRDAVAEYSKRLSAYTRLDIIEVEDEKTPDRASISIDEQIKRKEGRRILSRLPDDAYVIAMAIDGRQYSSIELAAHFEALTQRGSSSFAFVIGGSLGLSDEVLARSDERISFSKLTFPHQMMRVVLLEQIYRSFRIQRNEPYHK